MDEGSGVRRPWAVLTALVVVGLAVVAGVWLIVGRTEQTRDPVTASTPEAAISGFLRAFNAHDENGTRDRACADNRETVALSVARTSRRLISLRLAGPVQRSSFGGGGYGSASPAGPPFAAGAQLSGPRATGPGDEPAVIQLHANAGGHAWCVAALVGLVSVSR